MIVPRLMIPCLMIPCLMIPDPIPDLILDLMSPAGTGRQANTAKDHDSVAPTLQSRMAILQPPPITVKKRHGLCRLSWLLACGSMRYSPDQISLTS